MDLVMPYASVYMLALGLKDVQIGLITTIGLLAQVIASSLGGLITDKFGRRLTTTIFDLLAYSIPTLIWVLASFIHPEAVFWCFTVAIIINATGLISQTSWRCLLVEDANRDQIPHIFSLISVTCNFSAFLAPVVSLLVSHFSLLIAVRVLYVNAFIMMTVKTIITFAVSRETNVGKTRRRQTKDMSFWQMARGYRAVFGLIRRSPATIFALGLSAIVGAVFQINVTFWQVIATQKLLVPDNLLPYFPMTRSIFTIVFYLTIIHRITGQSDFKKPLLAGFGCYLVGQVLLSSLASPTGGVATGLIFGLLGVCLLFDSLGLGLVSMLSESLVALNVDEAERSRIMGVQRTLIILTISPCGWIGGLLSEVNRSFPFVLTSVLIIVGMVATVFYYRSRSSSSESLATADSKTADDHEKMARHRQSD